MAIGGWYNYFVSFAAAVGGFLFGYELGIINSVLEMEAFQIFFGLYAIKGDAGLIETSEANTRTANIVSFFLFGCIPGAIIITLTADILGRRRSVWLGASLFTMGAFIQAFSSGTLSGRITMIAAGRFIGGLGVGILSGAVPLFIAELAPAHIRGRLTTIYQLMITIGIAFATIVNAIIIGVYKIDKHNNSSWRTALGIQVAPGLLLIVMLFFIPESPRWLITKGHDQNALRNLAKLRQLSEKSPEVQEEYHEYEKAYEAELQVGSASWSELKRPGILNRVLIGITLQFFQQWTGINAVMYYSSTLFRGMGLSRDMATQVAVVVQNILNVIGTFPGMYLIERAGRKKLLFFGGIGIAITMWLIVLFLSLFEQTEGVKGVNIKHIDFARLPRSAHAYSILSVVLIFLFVLIFASTWGPVVWVYQSEIFPARVRGKGSGLATISNWVSNAAISYMTPYTKDLGSLQYIIFGTMGILMAAFVWVFVPETRGKSFEEMDEVFGFNSSLAARSGEELKA